jgi:hypothetical protein
VFLKPESPVEFTRHLVPGDHPKPEIVAAHCAKSSLGRFEQGGPYPSIPNPWLYEDIVNVTLQVGSLLESGPAGRKPRHSRRKKSRGSSPHLRDQEESAGLPQPADSSQGSPTSITRRETKPIVLRSRLRDVEKQAKVPALQRRQV